MNKFVVSLIITSTLLNDPSQNQCKINDKAIAILDDFSNQ